MAEVPTDITSLPVSRLKYREAYDELRRRQKPGAGVPAYTRWPNRAMARAVTPIAYRFGLTPNQVTLISALVSAAGLGLLVLLDRSWLSGVTVAVLLATGFVLDSVDGQLARLTRRGGPAGEWFDHVVDAIRTPAIHLTVAIVLYAHDPHSWWWLVGCGFALLSAGQFMSQILAEQLRTRSTSQSASDSNVERAENLRHSNDFGSPSPGTVQSWVLLPTDTGTLCWVFIVWGWVGGFEVAYALLAFTAFVHTATSMRRRYRELQGISDRGTE